MDIKLLKEKYEKELNECDKIIRENVVKAENLHAKLGVIADLEAELEPAEKAEEVEAVEEANGFQENPEENLQEKIY